MDFNISELYVIRQALEARLEYALDGGSQEEVPFLKSALNKIEQVKV